MYDVWPDIENVIMGNNESAACSGFSPSNSIKEEGSSSASPDYNKMVMDQQPSPAGSSVHSGISGHSPSRLSFQDDYYQGYYQYYNNYQNQYYQHQAAAAAASASSNQDQLNLNVNVNVNVLPSTAEQQQQYYNQQQHHQMYHHYNYANAAYGQVPPPPVKTRGSGDSQYSPPHTPEEYCYPGQQYYHPAATTYHQGSPDQKQVLTPPSSPIHHQLGMYSLSLIHISEPTRPY